MYLFEWQASFETSETNYPQKFPSNKSYTGNRLPYLVLVIISLGYSGCPETCNHGNKRRMVI